MGYTRAVSLGDFDDQLQALGDTADDADNSGDDIYHVWARQIKAQGGTVTSPPSTAGSYAIPLGAPMARYPIARAQQLGLSAPDAVSGSGVYWYFLAPSDVMEFFFTNIMSTLPSSEAVDKGTAANTPQWFKDLSTAGKAMTAVAIGAGILYGLSLLPRGRQS